ncbi:MAG TPA: sterol desaturase family protein [Rhabdaerophilum sp.]|nr:sterol desaturase family protein [Rhabdaerophilum sp.]
MPSEPILRVIIFLSVFAVLALAESVTPFRAASRRMRWPGNLGLFMLGIIAVRIVLPLGAVGYATWLASTGTGLFNQIQSPAWLAILASVILLDLAIYAQHVLFHKVPVLWRLHRVHHADTEMDATTGIRFHPLEIVVSLGFKLGAITMIGTPPFAVFLFEVLLNAGALFTHANLNLPAAWEGRLRLLLVTPGMHRVHHSRERVDTDSNYGFNLTVWDRLFRTYRPEPVPGETNVVFGIETFRDPCERRMVALLTQPFRSGQSTDETRQEPGPNEHAG